MSGNQLMLAGAPASVANYIEDVFSTYLYTGNGSTQTITNGIDLSGKGGFVWTKNRDTGGTNHILCDTARGITNYINSNNTNGQNANGVLTDVLTGTTTSGYTLGADATLQAVNVSTKTYVSWTFREQPKFFDVVTYTGNGTTQAISHNLGSTPGCVIVKSTTGVGTAWYVWHRSFTAGYYAFLNTTAAQTNANSAISFGNNTTYVDPTSTNFTVGSNGDMNDSGQSYVAYLFAHDAGGFGLTGSDNVITCGSYTGNGSTSGPTVTLGYEPQWLMIKNTSGTGGWIMFDNMRGFTVASGGDPYLFANTSAAEVDLGLVYPTATGFGLSDNSSAINTNGSTYIYIAIRRGPMKTPTSATSVFYPQAVSQADTVDSTNVPFPPDLVNTFSRDGTQRATGYNQFQFADRLRSLGVPNNTLIGSGCPALRSSSTAAEATSSTYIQLKADGQNITRSNGWNSADYGNWIYYFMRRAPGFFDVVCDTGTGSAHAITHNLGVTPEFIIRKTRSGVAGWFCYHSALGNTKGIFINSTLDAQTDSGYWNNTSPTSTQFTVGTSGDTNQNTSTFVTYLFATVAGVSKVGSYTGTGALQTVNCGFTGGARFVLIKRTDSTGDWYVWDSARGIVAGNDPYLLLNSTAAEVTNTDYVDTYSAGFEISSTAPAAINANGGTFIFLAIA